jgi:hypothetical protein
MEAFHMLMQVIEHSLEDCIKMLPFLFVAFFILEAVEHYAQEKMEKALSGLRYGGPVVGALLGCVPQCGFSIIAAGLYSGGMITLGTLLSVFLATSDEAILILLGNPGAGKMILPLLCAKIGIAVVVGYLVDFVVWMCRKRSSGRCEEHSVEEICVNCGCHDHGGILKPALKHTVRIFFFLLLFTVIMDGAIEWAGTERISSILLKNSMFQPLLAALVGMIPNCAASVLLTELYIGGLISFPSVIAGLCTGAGLGIPMLCKVNHHKKENLRIILLLYGISVAAGMFLQLIW